MLGVGAGDRHRQALAVGRVHAGRPGPVEDELHRRVDRRSDLVVGDLAVVDDVHVDDRRAPETLERLRVDAPAAREQLGGLLVRDGEDDGVSLDALAVDEDGRRLPDRLRRGLHRRDPGTAVHRGAEPLQQRHRRVDVEPAERDPRPADVGSVGLGEQPCLEDLRRQGEGGLGGVHVHRRQGDEVPQQLDGVGGLAVAGQEGAEGLGVERGVAEAQAAQRQGGATDPRPVREAQVAVGEQRRREVQRRGQRAPPDPGHLGLGAGVAGGAEDGDREPRLERRQLGRAEALEEAAVGRAAAQVDVLAVVERQAPALERPGRSAEAWPSLEQGHARPAVGAGDRRAEPGEAAADDDDVGGADLPHTPAPARLRAATQAFSHAGRETRRSRTTRGSRSIRARRRR